MNMRINENFRSGGIVILPVLAAVLMVSLIVVANYQILISQMNFQSAVEEEMAITHQATNVKETINAGSVELANVLTTTPTSPGFTVSSAAMMTEVARQLQSVGDGADMPARDRELQLVPNSIVSTSPNWTYSPFSPSTTWDVPASLRGHILYSSLGGSSIRSPGPFWF
jgi:hypothetical protein